MMSREQLHGGLAVRLDAQQLGDLLDGDEQRQAEDEPEEHRLGEELGDATELQRSAAMETRPARMARAAVSATYSVAALDGHLADGRPLT